MSKREALDLELEVDRFLGRYGEPATSWERKDLLALLTEIQDRAEVHGIALAEARHAAIAHAEPARPAPGEVLERHREMATFLLKQQFGNWTEDIPIVAKGLAAAEQSGFAAGRASVNVRPLVLWFAEQMESALRRNDHKGGWHDCHPLDLANRVADEQDELSCALQIEDEYEASVPPDPARVIAEAADVANVAMMVADHFRTGGPSKDQGREALPPPPEKPTEGGGRE